MDSELDWTDIGTVEFDDMDVVVQQWGSFVRIVLIDPDGEMSVAMGAGTREQFQRLFMEAERQAEASAATADDFTTAYGRTPEDSQ